MAAARLSLMSTTRPLRGQAGTCGAPAGAADRVAVRRDVGCGANRLALGIPSPRKARTVSVSVEFVPARRYRSPGVR